MVGIDYAGPLFCLDRPNKKLYVCLFTCAVVRAVHVELTESLNMKDFILAFRRFSARRGLPSVIYSDNAKTFQGSVQLLSNMYGPLSPKWKFIAPISPWWGGWWERMVKSVKGALRRSLGKACLTRCELETTLFEVENCVNSRPLTFVGDEIQSSNPLTPNHFLSCKVLSYQGGVIEDHEAVSAGALSLREKVCRQRLDSFWQVWRTEYLRNLPLCVPKFKERGSLTVVSVVLIHEYRQPRLQWEVGVVIEVLPGKDQKVRSVKLHTRNGIKLRSIQRLHMLEYLSHVPHLHNSHTDSVNDGCKDEETNVGFVGKGADGVKANDVATTSHPRTRAGISVKPVQKLDL